MFSDPPKGQGRKLDRDHENAIIARAQAGDIAARNSLVEHHLPLIWRFTQKALPRTETVEDWIGLGAEAFMRAIRDFDPSLGYRLSTLACRNIVRNVRTTYLRTKDLVRVPTDGKKDTEHRRAALERGRARKTVPIHATEGDRPIEIAYTADEPERHAGLATALSMLDPRQREILQGRFSNATMTGLTLERIGEQAGVCKERVRQVERSGLERLADLLARP